MLRRISTSSIIISIVTLMLVTVSAFAQSGSNADDEWKGIILLDYAGNGGDQTSGATIWAQHEADGETTQTVSYTVSDGTQLRGIILLDFAGNGGAVQTSGATIWAGRGGTSAASTAGSNGRSTVVFTDYNGTRKGVMVMDAKGVMVGDAPGVMVGDAKGVMVGDNKGRSLKGIILPDGRIVSTYGSATGQTSELSIVGSDGTQLRGIILLDFAGNGGAVQTSGATIWAGKEASEAGTTDGAAGGKIVKVVDESGAFLGLLYLGDGPAPFKGYIFGGR